MSHDEPTPVRPHPEGLAERAGGFVDQALDQGRERLEAVTEILKPRLRGWLHAGTFPLSVLAGGLLVILAPQGLPRLATAVFAVTAALLFGVSAIYHRGRWGPRATSLLKRFDHANIFLIIAGTYTPFSVLLLPPGPSRTMLWIVWTGALAGIAFRVFWVGAPRWLYVPVYIALGWVAVVYLPQFWAGAGVAVFVLVVLGGALYTAGGIVYGLRRPNPSPRWFGFHEVFHAFTVAAFLAHVAGIGLAVSAA